MISSSTRRLSASAGRRWGLLAATCVAALLLTGCCRYDGRATPPPDLWEPPSDPVSMANAIMTSLITQSPFRDFRPRTLHEASLPADQAAALAGVADELHRKLLLEPHIRLSSDPGSDFTLYLTIRSGEGGDRQLVASLVPVGSQEAAWSYPLDY